MSVIVKINTIDRTSFIEFGSLFVKQNLTNLVDTAAFSIRKVGTKTLVPEYNDDIEIFDGAEKIFAGKILNVDEVKESNGPSFVYSVNCVDHTYEFDKLLVARTYVGDTIKEIIDDIVANFTPAGSGFTTNNVTSSLVIDKIVFNQIPNSQALKKLADLLQYDWYIDADKDIHFFSKEINLAPFNLTDTSGNFVNTSLRRLTDGSQLVNRVKVRGGEYDGATITDSITVSGNVTKSFQLPNKIADLTIKLNTVSQTVGEEFNDDFTSFDVLHNYQDQSFKFENALSDGDVIEFSGKPKIRIFAIAEDSDSVNEFGAIEKLIRDNSIADNTLARNRANAELLAYASERVNAGFITYEPGLRSGMFINISSAERASNDDLIIKTITFSSHSKDDFVYNVGCVTTKQFEFVELLQKIVAAEPLDVDEIEASEQIFAANEEMTFTEDIQMVDPLEANEEMTFAENYLLDPLGAGVNAEYVLSKYIPTGQLDTLRPGRLDISLRLYPIVAETFIVDNLANEIVDNLGNNIITD